MELKLDQLQKRVRLDEDMLVSISTNIGVLNDAYKDVSSRLLDEMKFTQHEAESLQSTMETVDTLSKQVNKRPAK